MLPAVQEEARRVDPVSRGWMCVLVQTLYTGQPNMQPLNFQVLCIVTGCFLCKLRVFSFTDENFWGQVAKVFKGQIPSQLSHIIVVIIVVA